jgi:hypothetical protein
MPSASARAAFLFLPPPAGADGTCPAFPLAMKNSARRLALLATIFSALASLARAHPGHDGGHELTWDLSHLAAHPAATALWALVLAAAAWGGARLAVALAERVQSFRKSAASPGK